MMHYNLCRSVQQFPPLLCTLSRTQYAPQSARCIICKMPLDRLFTAGRLTLAVHSMTHLFVMHSVSVEQDHTLDDDHCVHENWEHPVHRPPAVSAKLSIAEARVFETSLLQLLHLSSPNTTPLLKSSSADMTEQSLCMSEHAPCYPQKAVYRVC